MQSSAMDDPILRENRRAELARRLLSHGVRTKVISKLTGLTRNRLATVRKRLMVHDEARRRGPTRSSPDIFLGTTRSRSEGAALASLSAVFGIPVDRGAIPLPQTVSLTFTERLCETYEAYRACFPQGGIDLEELILLRSHLATGNELRTGRCRNCRALMLVDPFEAGHRTCPHCEPEI